MVYTRIIVACVLSVLAQVKSEVLFRGATQDGGFAEVRRLETPGVDGKTVTFTSQRILGSPGTIMKSEMSSSGGSLPLGDGVSSRFLNFNTGIGGGLGLPSMLNPFGVQQNPFNTFGSPLGQFPLQFPQQAVPGIPQLPGFGNIFGGNPLPFNSMGPISLLSARSLPSAKEKSADNGEK